MKEVNNHKRIIKYFIVILFLCLAILSWNLFINRNTRNAEITIGNSNIYSEKEIKKATKIVLKKIRSFPATLKKIWYEENNNHTISEACEYENAKKIIIWTEFKTNNKAYKQGLNPNSDYTYHWILVKNNNKWIIEGYGQG